MEYLLLVASGWIPDAEEWFQSLSGWHIAGIAAAMLVGLLLATRFD